MPRSIPVSRAAKYCAVGIIPFVANLATTSLLIACGISPQNATVTGFFVGGQVSFWSHDRLTFGDRHVSLNGWTKRWTLFMPGQAAGFMANYFAAATLTGIDAALPLVYAIALVCGVTMTFTWNNVISHRPPPDPARVEL